MREPIVVIGAGPAGLTAAIILAKHGYKVHVHEMSSDVGHRLSGDFQGIENWSSERDVLDLLLEIGLEINFLCAPYSGGLVYAPEMDPVEIASERPIFYLVKRGGMEGTLDRGLKEQALSAGVKISFNSRIDATRGNTIVATGPRGVDTMAVGITFETAMKDRAVALFDDEIAPKGYAYLLIHGGKGTLASVLFREHKKGNECFERMREFFTRNVAVDIRNERRFCSYGNFFIAATQKHHTTLYIGESAGFQDFLWGFGMRYAILSGYLAARSFIEGSDYDILWKRELQPMLETSLVNRYLFERIGHAGYRYLTRKFSQGNPCDYLRKHYNYSLSKHLLLPLVKSRYGNKITGHNGNLKSCSCEWCRNK